MRNIPRSMDASNRAIHLFAGIESCYQRGITPDVLVSQEHRKGFVDAFNEHIADLVEPVPAFRAFHETVNTKSQFTLLIDAIAHRVRHVGVDLSMLHIHGDPVDRELKKVAKDLAAQINGYLELMCHLARETFAVEPLVRNRSLEEVFDEMRTTFFDAHLHSGEGAEAFRRRVIGTPLVDEVSGLRDHLGANASTFGQLTGSNRFGAAQPAAR